MIQLAPASIPLHRRLQTLAVFLYCLLIPAGLTLFFSSLSFPALRPFTLLYLLWIIYDQAAFKGTRRSNWVRNASIWKHFVAYYPIKLIKVSHASPFPSSHVSSRRFGLFSENATKLECAR